MSTRRNAATRLSCTLPLPRGYREHDFLEFHQRDPQGIAESIAGSCLNKGLLWDGLPACLTIRLTGTKADVELRLDGIVDGADEPALAEMARQMLGLNQPVEAFEQAYEGHPQLGLMIAKNPGLRVPQAATPFEALTWAVTGQQISVQAAISLRRKLILAAGARHSSGLACYPDAARIARLSPEQLRQAGFSQTKAQSLLTLSSMVVNDTLPLAQWALNPPPASAIQDRLLSIRGIGPWTVNYALLRGFGWLDGSLHGDAAVRRGIQRLLARPDPVTEAEARAWLAPFTPWRALVSAHLWATQSGQGEPPN